MRLIRVAAAALILTALAAGPAFAGAVFADLAITKIGSPSPLPAGTNATYTIVVQNLGPNTASVVSVSDTLPAGMTFVSLTGPITWTLTTPAVGSPGTVTATIAALTVAAGAQTFTLVTHLDAATAPGTIVTNTATVAASGSTDPTPGNNAATAALDVVAAPPTPVPSVPNAAMPEPETSSPFALLGFGALLVALLSATTALVVRRQPI
jgi:uncharacterized repeat protein (TIGR01451 family)